MNTKHALNIHRSLLLRAGLVALLLCVAGTQQALGGHKL